jgi:hypothetical protein
MMAGFPFAQNRLSAPQAKAAAMAASHLTTGNFHGNCRNVTVLYSRAMPSGL